MHLINKIPNKELLFLLVAAVVIFSIFANRFLTPSNFENILTGYSFLAILAIGQGLTIMVRGIDLSIGSNVALGAMVLFDLTMILQLPGYQAIPLATLAAYRGAVYAISGRQLFPELSSKPITDPWIRYLGDFIDLGGLLRLDGVVQLPWIPVSFVVLLIFAAVVQFAVFSTRWGLNLRTLGGNAEAAHLAGLNTSLLEISAYVICGLAAGLAAVILVGRFTTATEALGSGMELTSIAAAVIGGTRLHGGVGGVFGPLIGAFLLGVILIGLTLMGVSQFIQQILTGTILIAAVSYDRFLIHRSKKRAGVTT